MNRRSAIRNVIYFSAGAVLLPACARDEKGVIVLKNISLTGSQEKTLAALTESILPKTKSFIGAADLKAHEFILTMIDDCSSPEDQERFMNGQKAFEELTKKKFSKAFYDCSAGEKKELLKTIKQTSNQPGEVNVFYDTVRHYTIQSFTSSKEYLTQIRNYKMVPGPDFKGCVPVSS